VAVRQTEVNMPILRGDDLPHFVVRHNSPIRIETPLLELPMIRKNPNTRLGGTRSLNHPY
jgi:hypothetical protein